MSEIGISLANTLSTGGHKVSIIENSSEKLKSVSRITDAQIFEGDGADIDILRDAETDRSDALIACTNDDRTNLMSCLVANTMKVSRIISVVNYPKNEELFAKHGIMVVSEVSNIASSLELLLYRRSTETILSTVRRGIIIRVQMGEKSSLIDKPPKLKKGRICAVLRNDKLLFPEDADKLKLYDSLVIICLIESLDDVLQEVIGE